jgi:hypothetical protein
MSVVAKAAGDPSAALRDGVREALISLEAASVAVEMSGHGGPEKRAEDRAYLQELIDAALSAVRMLDVTATAKPKTIFPNAGMARAWCDANPLEGGLIYQIHRDGMGRCSVSINAPLEFL